MRIDKLLASMGYGSRKEVKRILKKGQVQVDGKTVKDGKIHVEPEQQDVRIMGEKVIYRKHIYLMMNKPAGVISATEDPTETCVTDLLSEAELIFQPFPVGRLDKDTEGLLLLTNDGQLAHRLLSPKKNVGKTYYARIDGVVTDRDVQAFKKGIILNDGYVCKPAELKIIRQGNQSEVYVTITEGKYHQIKRMFQAVEKTVMYLKRIQMGKLELDERLRPGEYRELTDDEMSRLG